MVMLSKKLALEDLGCIIVVKQSISDFAFPPGCGML
jgi:hypothetical protein